MPVPLPPVPAQPIAAELLRAVSQRAETLETPLIRQELWIPVGGEVNGDNVKLTADSQQYNLEQQVLVAQGNVRMDFRNSYLVTDSLEVNLKDRTAVAAGNIRLVRDSQEITAERLEYNFVRETGVLLKAKGTINAKILQKTELAQPLPNDPVQPLADQRVRPVTPTTQTGRILKFEAERITFDKNNWVGAGIKVTNDIFEPAELELRADQATVVRQADGTDQLDTGPASLVFDQGPSLPLPSFAIKLGGQEDTLPFSAGFDSLDRGGFFYQQNINLKFDDGSTLRIEPRLFVQRALGLEDQVKGFSFQNIANVAQAEAPTSLGENLGLGLQFQSAPGRNQRTTLFAEINGLTFQDIGRRVRLRAEQRYLLDNYNSLSFNYAYRERTFNGIFGAQPLSQRFEIALDSLAIPLDDYTDLSYTVSASLLQSPSDRTNVFLAGGPSGTEEATLGRFQAGVSVSRRFPLYQAEPTPATREFLRYSPQPLTSNISLLVGVTGVTSLYTNGDFQNIAEGRIGISGVVGEFARDFLDYTQFNLAYSSALIYGQSPFFFDRAATNQRITASFLQQVYGPFRLGIESSLDAGSGREIDRWYVLRYDRRTYGLSVSFSPIQRIGLFEFRIDDFNWGLDQEGRPQGPAPIENGLTKRRR